VLHSDIWFTVKLLTNTLTASEPPASIRGWHLF